MPINTVRSKATKALQKVASLVRDARTSRSERVLVVYDKSEANIYFERQTDIHKSPRSS